MRRRSVLSGLTCLAACAHAESQVPPRGSARDPLNRFFAALRGLADGTRKTPINVLQIGDSHTANDGFSGRMRELMQARFGNAGRGLLPPGIPFRFYKPDNVHVTATGWTVVSSFTPGAPSGGRGPFGITGLRQHAEGAATMTLETESPGDMAQLDIEFLATPGGGTASVSFDGGPPTAFSTRAERAQPVWQHFAAAKAKQVTLQTNGNGPVDMLSWSVRRSGPGITWSNLGTIGATVNLLARWDPSLMHAELQRADPALIVLAFGSNEGFQDDTNLAAYPAAYRAAIQALQAGAPNAVILLIGPPDGVRHPKPGGGTICPGGVWQLPINLDKIRQAQRSVAQSLDLPWWDWSAPMGGPCSMADWAAQTPPLAAADHLHLLHLGYRRTAAALFDDLMHGYDRFGTDAKN